MMMASPPKARYISTISGMIMIDVTNTQMPSRRCRFTTPVSSSPRTPIGRIIKKPATASSTADLRFRAPPIRGAIA